MRTAPKSLSAQLFLYQELIPRALEEMGLEHLRHFCPCVGQGAREGSQASIYPY